MPSLSSKRRCPGSAETWPATPWERFKQLLRPVTAGDGRPSLHQKATEEAAFNALVAADSIEGRDGNTLYGFPLDRGLAHLTRR